MIICAITLGKKEAFDKWPLAKELAGISFGIGTIFLCFAIIFVLLIWLHPDKLIAPLEYLPPFLMTVFAFLTFFGGFTIRKRLHELTQAEDRLVSNVEDATRRVLHGFPEIFVKAVETIKKAEREIWYVNFIIGFGEPHCLNKSIVSEYNKLSRRKLDEDVEGFYTALSDKVQLDMDVYILTLSDGILLEKFLIPLSDNNSYKELKNENCGDGSAVLSHRGSELFQKLTAQNKYFRKDLQVQKAPKLGKPVSNKSYIIHEADSVPIQILIVGLPALPGRKEERFGCLVFMVGTESRFGTKSGEEAGFYTELGEVVEVYRKLAWALIDHAISVKKEPGVKEAEKQPSNA